MGEGVSFFFKFSNVISNFVPIFWMKLGVTEGGLEFFFKYSDLDDLTRFTTSLRFTL